MDKVLLNALLSYFKAIKVKVSYRELELQLFSHPHTPSLFAIKDTLNFLKIENVATQIEHHQFNQLPRHFLAFIDDEGESYFSHIERKTGKTYLHGRKELLSKEDFFKKWDGTILLAEQREISTVSESPLIKYGLVAFIGLLAILLWPNFSCLIFCLLGVLGLFVSNEIFKTANEQVSNFGQTICGQEKDSGCNRVLKASNYKVSIFSLNDLLFAFQASVILVILLKGNFSVTYLIMYTLAILAVFFTIIAQGLILKAWCRLCLLSSTIILVQSTVVFLIIPLMKWRTTSQFMFLEDIVVFGLVFFISLVSVYGYRRLKTSYYKSKLNEIKLLQFKRSPRTIKMALSSTKNIKVLECKNEILLGNLKAKQLISLVLSTSCSVCKTAYIEFSDFYRKNSSKYSFRFILNHYDPKPSKNNDIAATMINSFRNNGPEEFLKIMNQWFLLQDLEKFNSKGMISYTEKDYQVLNEHRNWCKKNELFYTPIIIIDDKIVPEYYDSSFMGDIIESLNEID